MKLNLFVSLVLFSAAVTAAPLVWRFTADEALAKRYINKYSECFYHRFCTSDDSKLSKLDGATSPEGELERRYLNQYGVYFKLSNTLQSHF
jgi:hypothetical protein